MSSSPSHRVLVIGAAGGIGRAIAHHLRHRGVALAINDLGADVEGAGADGAPIRELAEELGCAASDADATKAPEALIELCERELSGAPTGIVWAAGMRRERGVLKGSSEDLERELDLGLRGPRALLLAATKRWIPARTPGSLVVLGSASAFFGAARQSAGAAAAGALVAWSRSAAVELRRHGIRLNVVIPTARTRQTEDLPLFRRVREGSMSPDHVAPVVSHLLGEDAAGASGEVLGIAGKRLYAFQSRETTGVIAEGEAFSEHDVESLWTDAVR